jgi:integrase
VRNGEYHADFCANGRRIRKRLSGDLDVATTILNELKARADKADFGLLDNDVLIAEIKAQYLRHCRQTLKTSTADRYVVCLDGLLPRLAASRVCQITLHNVLLFREERLREGTSPRTVNMDVSALSTMLRWARRHKLIGVNPLEDLKPLPNDRPKEGRALTGEEVGQLLEASPQPWRDIWYAFLVTGMRKEELASLTFREIDWEAREIIVRGGVAKNHRARRIPIDAGLWDILKKQEAARATRQPGVGKTPKITAKVVQRFTRDHVFVSTQNTALTHRSGPYYAFLRCCAAADIPIKTYDPDGHLVEHLDLHSLRRTFATSLIASGADPKSVQELLGHRTLDMTMRIYAKVHGQTKRQALGRLPYGKGTLAPEGVLEYPGGIPPIPVQNGHQMGTAKEKAAGG